MIAIRSGIGRIGSFGACAPPFGAEPAPGVPAKDALGAINRLEQA